MTTYLEFVTALANLNVVGVKRRLQAPPRAVATADLPLSYPRLPSGGDAPITTEGEGGWPTLTAELVIVVEPQGQSLQAVNFLQTVSLMDSVAEALRATPLAKAKNRWTVRHQLVNFGSDTNYWVAVFTVTSHG